MPYSYSIGGLGGLGLTGGSMYNSYDPMMGMYGVGGYANSYGMGGIDTLGMYGGYGMGMYDPVTYMQKIGKAQQSMETSQIQHGANMHEALTQARVQNLSAEDRAFFESVVQDGGIRANIENLARSIRTGNQNEICVKYDEVKNTILTRYNSYFVNHPNMDTEAAVRGAIENAYARIISAQAQEAVDLETDIKRYGESAAGNGYNRGIRVGFFGKDESIGGHTKYTEQTLNYIYKTGIDFEGSKEKYKKVGNFMGKLTRELLFAGIPGLIIGGLFKNKFGLAIGAGLGLAADYFWQKA